MTHRLQPLLFRGIKPKRLRPKRITLNRSAKLNGKPGHYDNKPVVSNRLVMRPAQLSHAKTTG